MAKQRCVVALAISLVLAGCVRSSVTQLTADTATISARGSAFNDMGEVQKRMLVDAANLTLQNGYDFFTIVSAASGYSTSYITTPGYSQTQTNYNLFVTGNMIAGSANTYGYSTPSVTSTVEKPRANISIRMGRGSPPANDPNSFDARAVLQFSDGASPEPTPSAQVATASSPVAASPVFVSLQDALKADLVRNLSPYPADVQSKVGTCVSLAISDGIPDSDQAIMLNSYNSHTISPEADDLFFKWIGVSYRHGPVMKPDINDPATYAGGALHYKDGTLVRESDPATEKRLESNLQRICPGLMRDHPEIFQSGKAELISP